jgi:hypothetical protein
MKSSANPQPEPRPALTLPAALAPELTGRPPPAREPAPPREAWSEETRELYRASLRPGVTPVNVYDVRTFHRLLGEAVNRAQQEQLPLAVVAFHAPTPGDGRQQRAVELTLRLGVRGEDFPTRLTATTVAVAVAGVVTPETALRVRLAQIRQEGAHPERIQRCQGRSHPLLVLQPPCEPRQVLPVIIERPDAPALGAAIREPPVHGAAKFEGLWWGRRIGRPATQIARRTAWTRRGSSSLQRGGSCSILQFEAPIQGWTRSRRNREFL